MDQGGGLGEEETEDQEGAPERETEVTVQEREVADLQIREPEVGGDVSLCEGYGGRGSFIKVCVLHGNGLTEEAIAAEHDYLFGHFCYRCTRLIV